MRIPILASIAIVCCVIPEGVIADEPDGKPGVFALVVGVNKYGEQQSIDKPVVSAVRFTSAVRTAYPSATIWLATAEKGRVCACCVRETGSMKPVILRPPRQASCRGQADEPCR